MELSIRTIWNPPRLPRISRSAVRQYIAARHCNADIQGVRVGVLPALAPFTFLRYTFRVAFRNLTALKYCVLFRHVLQLHCRADPSWAGGSTQAPQLSCLTYCGGSPAL